MKIFEDISNVVVYKLELIEDILEIHKFMNDLNKLEFPIQVIYDNLKLNRDLVKVPCNMKQYELRQINGHPQRTDISVKNSGVNYIAFNRTNLNSIVQVLLDNGCIISYEDTYKNFITKGRSRLLNFVDSLMKGANYD